MALDLNKIRDNYEKKTEGKGGIDRWKPQAGENYIRVLPHTLRYFTETIAEIGFTYFVHFDVGPEGAKEMVVCPKTLNRKNICPVCEAVALLQKSNDPNDQDLANRMGVRRRYLLNILDMKSAETIAKGVQVLECGPSIYNNIIRWCNPKWGDPLDLENGRNMTLTAIVPPGGNKIHTEYTVEPDPQTSSVVDKLPANWKEQIKRLETLVPQVKSYDEIKKILEGEVDYGSVEKSAQQEQGISPTPLEKPHVAPQQVTPQPAVPPAVNGTKPSCFGVYFSTTNSKCVACAVNAACKETFLKD